MRIQLRGLAVYRGNVVSTTLTFSDISRVAVLEGPNHLSWLALH